MIQRGHGCSPADPVVVAAGAPKISSMDILGRAILGVFGAAFPG